MNNSSSKNVKYLPVSIHQVFYICQYSFPFNFKNSKISNVKLLITQLVQEKKHQHPNVYWHELRKNQYN